MKRIKSRIKQLKISKLILELQKVKADLGDREIWYHICGNEVGKDMPMQVEGVKVIERPSGDTYVTIW